MPAKKKGAPPLRKPGIAKHYICENYSNPGSGRVKNGHILFEFYSCDRSLTETAKSLKTTFGVDILPSQVNSVANKSINYYKCLTKESEFKIFKSVCEEEFTCDQPSLQELPCPMETDSADSMIISETSQPLTLSTAETLNSDLPIEPLTLAAHATSSPTLLSTAPVSPLATSATRYRMKMTPQKKRLQKRLDFVSASKSKLQRQFQGEMKILKNKLKTPKRVVNQAIKRKMDIIDKKDREIMELKEKLEGTALAVELAKTKHELQCLKVAHVKLKKYKENRKIVPASRYLHLQKKLKDKNDVIKNLENENLTLKEHLDDLQSKDSSVKMKAGDKCYSTITRMMVFDHIVNQVPTANIPTLINQSKIRAGLKPDAIPHRSTVEFMAVN